MPLNNNLFEMPMKNRTSTLQMPKIYRLIYNQHYKCTYTGSRWQSTNSKDEIEKLCRHYVGRINQRPFSLAVNKWNNDTITIQLDMQENLLIKVVGLEPQAAYYIFDHNGKRRVVCDNNGLLEFKEISKEQTAVNIIRQRL